MTTPSFGMGTTSGSHALQGLVAKKDATIAVQLRNAGCIVIGKSNLSVSHNSQFYKSVLAWLLMYGIGVGKLEGFQHHQWLVPGRRAGKRSLLSILICRF